MRRILILFVMAAIITMPLAGAISITNQESYNINKSKNIFLNDEFTHTVFAELGSTAVCPYCPGASSLMYEIYNSEEYDFNYVTLVYNVGSAITQYKVSKRAYEELGIDSVPQAYFDGKYANVKGKPADEMPYRTKIEAAGAREVPDLVVDVNVVLQENSVLQITGTVINNEAEEYNGHLRVYIIEPESRWNDANGDPLHFAVLDIPVDKNLALRRSLNNQQLTAAETYDFSRTWRGSIVGYNDISRDNIMVIAAIFDKETDRAVQAATARPDALPAAAGYTNVTAEQAWGMLNDHSTIQYPIDVRTVAEWNLERIDTPTPEDPILYADLQHGVALQEFMEEYADKEVLIYCRSGNRSFIATELLLDNGFTGTIWQMVGGIKAWQAEGFPTKPKYTVSISVEVEKSPYGEGTITIEDNDYPIYEYAVIPCGDVGCYGVELPAGDYDITVSDIEGYKDQTKIIEVEEDTDVSFAFPKSRFRLAYSILFQFVKEFFARQSFPALNALVN